MYYLFVMKVFQSRYYLTTGFFQLFNRVWSPLFSNIIVHIASLLEFHNDMKLVIFGQLIIRVYKILIFDYTWVNKIFCYHKFTKHFSHSTSCYIRIVQHFSCLVHKSTFESYDTTLENFRLSSSRKLFFSFDI